jgi:hypothetical protein
MDLQIWIPPPQHKEIERARERPPDSAIVGIEYMAPHLTKPNDSSIVTYIT